MPGRPCVGAATASRGLGSTASDPGTQAMAARAAAPTLVPAAARARGLSRRLPRWRGHGGLTCQCVVAQTRRRGGPATEAARPRRRGTPGWCARARRQALCGVSVAPGGAVGAAPAAARRSLARRLGRGLPTTPARGFFRPSADPARPPARSGSCPVWRHGRVVPAACGCSPRRAGTQALHGAHGVAASGPDGLTAWA